MRTWSWLSREVMNSLRASVGTRELRRISSSQNPATVAMPRLRGVTSSSTGAGGGGAYTGGAGGTYAGGGDPCAPGDGRYGACAPAGGYGACAPAGGYGARPPAGPGGGYAGPAGSG